MPDERDVELLLAAGRGDRHAFGILVEQHHRAVVQFISRFLGDFGRDTADDLAQDVFLKAWTAARRFRPKGKVKTWLLQIARNTSLNYKRSHRLRRAFHLDADDHRARTSPDGVVQTVSAGERAHRVGAAIAGLPHKQRAVILLRYFHELPYAEIAAVLGVSVASVESLLFRARRAMHYQLASLNTERNSPQVISELGAKRKSEESVL